MTHKATHFSTLLDWKIFAKGMPALFAINRTAMPLFGLHTYGINVNAYVINNDGSISVWLQRRSIASARFAGKLDSFVSYKASSFECFSLFSNQNYNDVEC